MRKDQQSSQASEKEKGEGAVADVDPENGVGRTAAPARGQDASAELAESIRLFWSGILSWNEQTPR